MKIVRQEVILGPSVISRETLQSRYGTNFDSLLKRSGITSIRRCNPDQDILSTLSEFVIKSDLGDLIQSQEVIIVVSESLSPQIPPPSSTILTGLQSPLKAIIIDLNRGCSGFVESLVLAESLASRFEFKKILVITADNYSRYIRTGDRSTDAIFGDGASLTFFEASGKSVFHFEKISSPNLSSSIMTVNNELSMKGAEVIQFVKASVVPQISNVASRASSEEIPVEAAFIHQGSLAVVSEIRERLGWQESFCPFSSSEVGNLVSTSIPFVMKNWFSANKPAGWFLLSGFGVGLTSMTGVFKFEI